MGEEDEERAEEEEYSDDDSLYKAYSMYMHSLFSIIASRRHIIQARARFVSSALSAVAKHALPPTLACLVTRSRD